MSYRVSPTPWSLPIISKLASCVAHYHRLQVKVLELSSYWLRCWLAVKPTPFPYRVGGCLRHAVSVSHCVTLHCNSCCRRRQLAPTTSVSPCLSLPLDDDLARDLLDLHSCQCGIIQALPRWGRQGPQRTSHLTIYGVVDERHRQYDRALLGARR